MKNKTYDFDFFIIMLSILGMGISLSLELKVESLFMVTILIDVLHKYFDESCMSHHTVFTHGLKLLAGISWILAWVDLIITKGKL